MTQLQTETITIPVSPEQEDLIFDHVFSGKELGIYADEKVWMLAQARKHKPDCKIKSADLNIPTLEWDLVVEVNK